jgi:hypothetical protein
MTALAAVDRVDLDAEWNRVELMAHQVADRGPGRPSPASSRASPACAAT